MTINEFTVTMKFKFFTITYQEKGILMITQKHSRMSLFFGEGGGLVFCQFVTLYICHTSPREGGGLRESWQM